MPVGRLQRISSALVGSAHAGEGWYGGEPAIVVPHRGVLWLRMCLLTDEPSPALLTLGAKSIQQEGQAGRWPPLRSGKRCNAGLDFRS